MHYNSIILFYFIFRIGVLHLLYRNLYGMVAQNKMRACKQNRQCDLLSAFLTTARRSSFYFSSEKRGVCLMKCSGKMLLNFPYFIFTKTQSCFLRFLFHTTLFFHNECYRHHVRFGQIFTFCLMMYPSLE